MGDHLPTPQTNTTRCFPQKYQPDNDVPATTEWFNKYVVDAVIATDRTGGAPDMVTHYTYLDGAAWHFDDNDGITKDKLKTWSQWRGYAHTRVENGGTSGMSTQEEHYYLRGMDGDRTDPDDKTKTRSVSVPNGEGTTLTDDQAWSGYEYRSEALDGSGGKILAKSVNVPWKQESAKRVLDWGTTTSTRAGTATTRNFTSLDAGAGNAWRETRTNTTVDAYGRPSQVEALGDTAVTGDDQCTRTSYADNTTAWILTGVIHTETVAANCSATVNRDTQADGTSAVVADTRIRYDGQAYGAAPTKGLPTLTETLKSRTGTTATYVDNAVTYDVYGRVVTSTALPSTSVFDPTHDTTAPVTTPAPNPRTTTTVFTPAVGRPTKSVVTKPPATVGTPASAQVTTTYLDLLRGLPILTTDPNKRRTDLQYDALGRTQKVWLPDRSKNANETPNDEFRYASADGAIRAVATLSLNNDSSQDTSYTLYDGFGRARQTQTPGADGGRILTDTFYDERGQAVLAYAPYYATNPASPILFKVEDATGVESQTAVKFDGLGRPVKSTLLSGNGVGTPLATTTTVYGGDRTTITPPKGATPTTTITDAAGHTTELRQYKSATPTGVYDATTYSYDSAGHLTKLIDPSNAVWTWTYNQLGNQVKAVDPDSGTSTQTYNDRGELLATTDGRSKTITHVYDNFSRPTETHDGTATGPLLTSQTWDPSGNQGLPDTTTRYVAVGSTTYQYKTKVTLYDNLGRPNTTVLTVPSIPGQEALAGDYVTGMAYNLDGTVRGNSYPSAGNLPAESVATIYDKLHRPATISSPLSGYLGNQTYSLTNKPLKSTFNAGGKSTYVTNAYEPGTQRLSSSRTDAEGDPVPVRAAGYSYDEAGNVRSLTEVSHDGTDRQCFQYDYLARLTESFTPNAAACPDTPDGTALGGPAPYWTSYTYNPDGTRKTETQHDPTGATALDKARAYTYPATGAPHPHSLTGTDTLTGGTGSPVNEAYGYDASGHTTERHLNPSPTLANDQSLTWDSEGHLAKVQDTVKTKTGSTTFTTTKTTDYVYAPDGTRLTAHTVDTAHPTAENTTLYLGSTELNLVKGATKATGTRYYPLGAATAVRTNDNKVAFQVTDHHGTAAVSIDATTGAATQRRSTPFGADRGTAPAVWAGTKGFVGGTNDTDTGLTHIGAREYDSAIGRFISVDPMMVTADPQSLNGYTYSDNNPVTLSDPTGLRIFEGDSDGGYDTNGPGGASGSYDRVGKARSGGGINNLAAIGDPHAGDDEDSIGDDLKQTWNGFWGATKSTGSGIKKAVTSHAKNINNCFGGSGSACVDVAATYWSYSPMNYQFYIDNYHGIVDPAKDIADDYAHGRDEGGGKLLFFELSILITHKAPELVKGGNGAKSPPCSFPAGTLVLLADGTTKAIDQMAVGDEVQSADPETTESGPQPVDATIATPDDINFTTLTVAGTAGTSALTSTDNHPYWSPSEAAWIHASDVLPGMTLISQEGEILQVVAAKHFRKLQAAYNLTVRGFHTYYVLAGATSVLVHNCGGYFPGHAKSCACEGIGDITLGKVPQAPVVSRGATGISRAERISDAGSIARGHANAKHGSEFPGMSASDLEGLVRGTMSNPSRTKPLGSGREAYLGRDGSTVVIHDPMSPDMGTVFSRGAETIDDYWKGLN
ncbi:polymorphic toxin-type HINT domain-containing protein [Streptomyces sp. RKAG293]|uniref:polymorphic toxin-type HINT domain-containing protein n=1 Tax=Streptomyces sp. RKAG293 TaxID=2893403 RepID=UPI0020332B5E|nr:polymorphic toxin-type HINT domain-containing protein [Streptomyces sp. RKAG293]MCM2417703.1 hypothetical protein [Streptomyces sp. RKAG293]